MTLPAMKRLAAALLIAPATLRAQALTGRGVSIDLAQHRSRTIHDVRYELSLNITAPDSAYGGVTVRWSRSDTGDAILDFRGRRLSSITANSAAVPLSSYNGAHI